MTENIMLQETEMTKTGFCEICDAQNELKQCVYCKKWFCHECGNNFIPSNTFWCIDCNPIDEENDDE